MKNKNIIAITAYNKPDLLYIYLEQIYKHRFKTNNKRKTSKMFFSRFS